MEAVEEDEGRRRLSRQSMKLNLCIYFSSVYFLLFLNTKNICTGPLSLIMLTKKRFREIQRKRKEREIENAKLGDGRRKNTIFYVSSCYGVRFLCSLARFEACTESFLKNICTYHLVVLVERYK